MRFFLAVAAIPILGGGALVAGAQELPQRAVGPRLEVLRPDRVVSRIDESRVVTLLGNVHPLARGEFDRGLLGADTELSRMVLLLQPTAAQQEELDTLVAAQHDPRSPLYRKWLTPEQFGARFGASAADLAVVTRWLQGHGFRVEEIPASNRLIVFSGTAAGVAETFHTEMHRYRVGGVGHISNSLDPQIPEALSGLVSGVVSLHDFRRTAAMTSKRPLVPLSDATPSGTQTEAVTGIVSRPEYTTGGEHYLFPADFATIYDLNSLYSAGTSGDGASIAIVGRSNINLSDVAAFRTVSGLGASVPTVIFTGANPGLVAGDQDESTLDVEWAGAVAPAAQVDFVVGASTSTTDGVDLAAQYIVNQATATVVSTSYGSCEQDMGATELAFYNSLWEQAASEGISAFVASGDAGAAGCNSGSDLIGTVAGVNGLCSSPYSTCVGGTEFNEGTDPAEYWAATNQANDASALNYIPEQVWNESGGNGGTGLWASGGGVSSVYAEPAWQKAVSGTDGANGKRAVPDVAMSAAAHDGYITYENGSFWIISGTSAASPSLAGIMALVVESNGGTGQGNANAGLYPLVNAAENPFHATASGNNSVPGVAGYTAAGAEYNLSTGLGSVDGALLVKSWGASSRAGKSTDFALTVSATGGTVTAGKPVTFTVGVTESGAGKSAVALKAAGPTGVTVGVQPATIVPGSPATVTATAGTTAVAGTGNISITGTDASGSQTANYALTMLAPAASLTLSPASAALNVAQGSTATDTIGVAGNAAYSGPVTLSASGLPPGVTASWSSDPVTLTGGAGSSILTLLASRTASLGSATFTVTAMGDGVIASRQITAAVQQGPGVQLAVSPAAISVAQAGTTTLAVTATPVGGLTVANSAIGSNIALVSGVPQGFTAAWSGPGVSSTGAVVWTLTLSGSSGATGGSSALGMAAKVAAQSGTAYSATLSVPLTVTLPPPVLAIGVGSNPVTVAQGSTGTEAVTLGSNQPLGGPVTLSASGLPPGVTASWSNNPVTLYGVSGGSMLTLFAQKSAAAGPATFTVTASGGGAAASRQIGVTVTQAPGVQLALGVAALRMHRNGTVQLATNVTTSGGLSGAVTLAVSGLPAGVTASFGRVNLPAAGTAIATLTLRGSPAARAGTANVTVTSTAGGTRGRSYGASQVLTLTLE